MTQPEDVSTLLNSATSWPFVPVLTRIGLAIGIGLFIGLEREHSNKAGVRTFTVVALLGCLGGLINEAFAAIALAYVGIFVAFMNYRQMQVKGSLVLTTSSALAVVAFCGVLCGQGHVFTPVVAGVITAALLAWKQPISGFVGGLSDKELRSAILLAILTFVIYPILPNQPVDPWGLVTPKENWASVIIIAAIGFVNYVLLKLLGPKGMEITAFFGGLVNSRKVVVELTGRLKESGPVLQYSVYRGIMLATGAMVLRNGLIVAVLATQAATRCAIPLVLMLLASAILWRLHVPPKTDAPGPEGLSLESPFKISAALKFGLVFLLLNVVGALAQRSFGASSFYFVSIAGGLLSSGSSIASAATLMNSHEISVPVGINGIVLSTLTSIIINIPLILGITNDPVFKRKVSFALAGIALIGLVGVGVSAAVY